MTFILVSQKLGQGLASFIFFRRETQGDKLSLYHLIADRAKIQIHLFRKFYLIYVILKTTPLPSNKAMNNVTKPLEAFKYSSKS